MRRRIAVVTAWVAVVLAGALVAVQVFAQTAPPSAEKLLDNYVKASGGRPEFDKLNTRVTRARIDVTAAGISMAVTMWAARPNKIRTLAESDVVGRIERGFDGTVGWELSTTAGPRVLDGGQLDDMVRDSRFDGLAAWRDWVVKAETQGAAEVDGKPAWKVLVTPKRGSAQTLFFDQASSLVVKIEMIVQSAAGAVPVESYVSDFREVGGVRLPHRIRRVAAGQELVTTIESIAHNVEIPAGQFDLPKEIQVLVGKKKPEACRSPGTYRGPACLRSPFGTVPGPDDRSGFSRNR